MLASAAPSLPNFNPGERKAVVISLARANDRGDTTVVLCLDKSGMRDPFRLSNQGGRYIWSNQELRDNGIEVGSIISYQSCDRGCLYSGNTGKKVVSLALQFVPKHVSFHFGVTSSIYTRSRGIIRVSSVYIKRTELKNDCACH